MDIPIFYGRLDYSDYLRDPQNFQDWQQSMDIYFNQYPFSETEKVRFAIMKLTGQANQYWRDLERDRKVIFRQSIDTWDRMKKELETKYVPSFFYESRPSPSVQLHRSKIIIPPVPHLGMILRTTEIKVPKRSLPLLNAIIVKVMDIKLTLASVSLGLSL